MSRALGIGRLSDALPLPGLLKTIGHEKDQCQALAKRFDRLIAVFDRAKDLEGFAEILSQLQAMKNGFEKKVRHKSRLPKILGAQDRFQAYECLNQEVTELMESRRGTEERSLVNKRWIDGNFTTIDAYKLSYGEQEPFTRSTWSWVPFTVTGAVHYRSSPVHVTQHFGRLGKLRVVYMSFRSHSDHTAKTKTAEEGLKQLSRVRHKNVAAIVGVTKGCDGLDGIVVAMEGVPIKLFLCGSVTGSALGRYDAHDFLSSSRPYLMVDDDGESVTVAPDGQVTVLPSWGRRWVNPDFMRWTAMRIYQEEWHRSEYYAREKQTSRLTEALLSLGGSSLTELRLLKVLADYTIEPFGTQNFWPGHKLAPFAVRAGDLGIVEGRERLGKKWQVLEASGGADETERADFHIPYGSSDCKCRWQRLPGMRHQFRTWVTNYHDGHMPTSFFHKSISRSVGRWGDVMNKAKALSKQHKLELHQILYGMKYLFTWVILTAASGYLCSLLGVNSCLRPHRRLIQTTCTRG
ncbi:hypothetical protein BDV93DRAFT_524281 [Ceratobasidium sp. AG-I]|nr:hypothetical protein BDV93DRAFT_524281 [Ceratobasidium sp. AG-I]